MGIEKTLFTWSPRDIVTFVFNNNTLYNCFSNMYIDKCNQFRKGNDVHNL